MAGEEHVQGTVIATGSSSLTVKTSSGATATYAIQSTTQIVRDGQPTTLSALRAGDPVVVHVVPSSSGSSKLVEMVLAGSSTTAGPGAFAGPPSGATAPSGSSASGGTSIN